MAFAYAEFAGDMCIFAGHKLIGLGVNVQGVGGRLVRFGERLTISARDLGLRWGT